MFTMPTISPCLTRREPVKAAATVGQAEAEQEMDDELPMRRYSTRAEAIEREILAALGEHADVHDVEAIASEVLGDYEHGFACMVDAPTFWGVVEHHAKPGA
ncbi:MAG: hypothetical protein ACTHU1_13330 [Arachnia sp.]